MSRALSPLPVVLAWVRTFTCPAVGVLVTRVGVGAALLYVPGDRGPAEDNEAVIGALWKPRGHRVPGVPADGSGVVMVAARRAGHSPPLSSL